MQELEMSLRNDLLKIGLDVDFNLSIRPYSKSYFGRYDVKSNTIILYVQKTPNGDMYPYCDLLLTVVHEAVHCVQWSNPKYERVKGIMHNAEFKKLYAVYSNRAKARVLFGEVLGYDFVYQANYRKSCHRSGVVC